MNEKILRVLILIFIGIFMLTGEACTVSEAEPEILVSEIEESTLVYSGIVAKAHLQSKLDPGRLLLTRNYYWTLLFEEGPVIMFKESPFWFCPIGKRVNVYKCQNETTRKWEYYVEIATKEEKK